MLGFNLLNWASQHGVDGDVFHVSSTSYICLGNVMSHGGSELIHFAG